MDSNEVNKKAAEIVQTLDSTDSYDKSDKAVRNLLTDVTNPGELKQVLNTINQMEQKGVGTDLTLKNYGEVMKVTIESGTPDSQSFSMRDIAVVRPNQTEVPVIPKLF
jgi:hypothetical protein